MALSDIKSAIAAAEAKAGRTPGSVELIEDLARLGTLDITVAAYANRLAGVLDEIPEAHILYPSIGLF